MPHVCYQSCPSFKCQTRKCMYPICLCGLSFKTDINQIMSSLSMGTCVLLFRALLLEIYWSEDVQQHLLFNHLLHAVGRSLSVLGNTWRVILFLECISWQDFTFSCQSCLNKPKSERLSLQKLSQNDRHQSFFPKFYVIF